MQFVIAELVPIGYIISMDNGETEMTYDQAYKAKLIEAIKKAMANLPK